MTDQQHPITPPSELEIIWSVTPYGYREAARWGADQELEACCDVIARELNDFDGEYIAGELRTERRSKPMSIKEQALDDLYVILAYVPELIRGDEGENIRRAIESLPD